MCQVLFVKNMTNLEHLNCIGSLNMNTQIIHIVVKLTGLSTDVIPVRERGFEILKPILGANRYRNYSEDDVALLRFLKEQLDTGDSIGELSKLGGRSC